MTNAEYKAFMGMVAKADAQYEHSIEGAFYCPHCGRQVKWE